MDAIGERLPASRVHEWLASRRRHLAWIAPAAIVLLGAYWTVLAAYRYTFAILSRDPGIFQYVAWAIGRGERDYVDLREINGPLPHLIHLLFLQLGGADEHVFRTLDILCEAAVFAAVGAMLPGIGRSGDAPPAAEVRNLWPARALWAAAAAVVLTAQYLILGWWQTAQRENFYDLFLLTSIGLQLCAQRPGGSLRPKHRVALLAAAGALDALTWFGKPTNVLFSALQTAALLLDTDAPIVRRRALTGFTIGSALGCVAMIGFAFAVGDPFRGARIVFGEVPRLYRFIWKISLVDCYRNWNNAPKLNYAFATLPPVALAVALGWLPRRFLVACSLLVGGLAAFFVQGKGFPYHLHPILLGTHLLWIATAAYVAERAVAIPWERARWWAVAVTAGAVLMGAQSSTEARMSEYAQSDAWRVGSTPSARASEAYFRLFPWDDYFPWELRQAATFLRERTSPDDRVQMYGLDPYLLFLAQRRSATPYLYGFELNVDAALLGGSGGAPDDAEREWLRATARRHEMEMLGELQRRPPAAFALIDRSPFTFPPDSVVDFAEHCPQAAAWMSAHYREAARFGAVRVWLASRAMP
jgi:hypothetical protein